MPIEQIVRIIETTLARFGQDATYDDYRTVAFELFREEMRAKADALARFLRGKERLLARGFEVLTNEEWRAPPRAVRARRRAQSRGMRRPGILIA